MTERNESVGVITRTCRFPECTRPAEEGDGRGRPPAYCDDPAHTRAAAFRARRDAESGGDVDARPPAVDEPVTFARVRAGLLVERVEAAVAALSTMTTEVVAELRTLGDVEAVEVELESVSASAEQRAAEARSVAAEAETRRRRAEAATVEAEQLRDEAESAAEEALSAEARAREAAQEAERIATSAQEEAERLSAEVTGLLDERDAALTQARELTGALAAAQGDLEQVREALTEQTATAEALGEQVETESARAVRAEATAVDLRRTLDERDQAVATLQGQVADQRTALAQAQVRVEETAAQRDQLRAQVTERDERIHGLESDHAGARAEVAALTAQLHAEQAAAAAAAALAERTATARVAEVRALYEERITELRQQQGKTK